MGLADEYEKSQQRVAIIKTIRENGPMTPKELAEAMGENHPKIKSLLWKMRKEEELTKEKVISIAVFYSNDTILTASMAFRSLPTNRWEAKLRRKPAFPSRSLGTRGVI